MKYKNLSRALIVTTLALPFLLFTSCGANGKYRKTENLVSERFVHEYGVEVPQEYWATHGKSGKVISTTKEGVTITHSYNKGVLDGETTYTFPHNHTIQKREIYREGELLKKIENFSSGTPKLEEEYLSPGYKKVIKRYEQGTIASEEEYDENRLVSGKYYNLSEQIESRVEQGYGKRTRRDVYGKMMATEVIEAGFLSSSTTYHENGNPKEIVTYKNGVPHGEKRTYFPGGEPNTIEQWVNGRQHGTTVVFRNGALFAEVPYVNGKKEGVEYRYNDDQILVEEIQWKNNRRHGPTHTYVQGHKSTKWYVNGRNVSKKAHDQFLQRRSLSTYSN